MSKNRPRIFDLLLLLALIPAASASAAEGDCRADMEKFCPDVDPTGPQAMACLKENIGDLSAGCKDNIQKLVGAMQSFGKACGQDVKTLCADVEPGGGRVLKCLQENQASVSAGCSGFLSR